MLRGLYETFEDLHEPKIRITRGVNLNFVPHLHPQIEIMYLLDGGIFVTVDGKTQWMEPGDFVFVANNHIHSYITPEYSENMLAIFEPSLVPFCERLLKKKELESPFLSLRSYWPFCDRLIEEMLHEFGEGDGSTSANWAGTGYFNVLLGKAFSYYTLRDAVPAEKTSLQNILFYLSDNFDKPLTLDRVAEDLHLSKYYISHLFRSKIGYSFPSYLNYLRMNEARRLLAETDRPMAEVAFACGFESIRSFNRACRALTGATPTELRRMD